MQVRSWRQATRAGDTQVRAAACSSTHAWEDVESTKSRSKNNSVKLPVRLFYTPEGLSIRGSAASALRHAAHRGSALPSWRARRCIHLGETCHDAELQWRSQRAARSLFAAAA